MLYTAQLNISHPIDGNMDEIESQWPGEITQLTGPVEVILGKKPE